jgi:cell division transport system permease protein
VLTIVVFTFRRAWQGFWRNALMSLAATLTMVLMLLLLAGFFILQNVLLASLSYVEQKVEVVAYVENTATQGQVDELVAKVDAMPETASVEFVSRDEALRRFREAQAAQGREDLTKYLEANPLYASINVKLTAPGDLATVVAALRDEPIVRNVLNIEALVDRVVTVTTFVRTAGVAMVAIVGLIVLFIIVNTIRLAVVARAEEIEIMRLVGASDAFIRWPFIFEGLFVGLIGAGLTLALLGLAAGPISQFTTAIVAQVPVGFDQQLGLELVGLVVGAGALIGGLGAWISVRSYLIR